MSFTLTFHPSPFTLHPSLFPLQPKRAFLSDINEQFVEIYQVIQSDVDALISALHLANKIVNIM